MDCLPTKQLFEPRKASSWLPPLLWMIVYPRGKPNLLLGIYIYTYTYKWGLEATHQTIRAFDGGGIISKTFLDIQLN